MPMRGPDHSGRSIGSSHSDTESLFLRKEIKAVIDAHKEETKPALPTHQQAQYPSPTSASSTASIYSLTAGQPRGRASVTNNIHRSYTDGMERAHPGATMPTPTMQIIE